jgi:hypothetical protein
MDFQRLFKRKAEGSAPPGETDDAGDALKNMDVIIREGELLEGNFPASLLWNSVSEGITVKAGKILGIMEGRTRIKAGVLQELHPSLFSGPVNPDAEFNIPLHVVVTQIQHIFSSTSSMDTAPEGFDTPFAELAREDEARFKAELRDGTLPIGSAPATGATSNSEDKDLEIRLADQPRNGADADSEGGPTHTEKTKAPSEQQGTGSSGRIVRDDVVTAAHLRPAHEFRNPPARVPSPPTEVPHPRSTNLRRAGYERLQELYLTDEPVDGSIIADFVLRLPRVTGVVIMLSDGAVLGGEVGAVISAKILHLATDFVTHVLGFTENLPGGPTRFITFFGHALQISLAIAGDVLMLTAHEGKNLPPGLRERLIATTEALNIIYGSQREK